MNDSLKQVCADLNWYIILI